MPSSLIASALGGTTVGLLYFCLFKKQVHAMFMGLSSDSKVSRAKMILRHVFFLAGRFLIIGGIIGFFYVTKLVDLSICCIFVVTSFLVSMFFHTKGLL
jgi:hypothetical protein